MHALLICMSCKMIVLTIPQSQQGCDSSLYTREPFCLCYTTVPYGAAQRLFEFSIPTAKFSVDVPEILCYNKIGIIS